MWELIARAAQTFGPAPMYTWVTDVSRIELSGTTFLNGVSKAANMLRDGLDVEDGESIYCNLGNHWQSPVWLAAAMSVQAVLDAQTQDALCVVDRDGIEFCSDARDIVIISRDPFGMPERDLSTSVVNGSLEVRGYGDHFSAMGRFADIDVVCRTGESTKTKTQLVAAAQELVAQHKLTSTSRVAIDYVGDLTTRLLWQVIVPAVVGCSVVLIDGTVDIEALVINERIDSFITLSTTHDVKE